MRLQHVGITVRPEEIERARAFYRDELELPELYATERALVYGLGRVAELEDTRTRLAGNGCEITDARPVGGRERFFVRDPFGNLIEFVTPRS